jgi:structure-specific recognition protein 1
LSLQGKKIGEMFRGLTPEEKSKYEALAATDKQRYAEAMKTYKKKEEAEKDGLDEDPDEDEDDDDDSDSD